MCQDWSTAVGKQWRCLVWGLLHASRTAGVIAVVDIQALALQDEGADAVLYGSGSSQ